MCVYSVIIHFWSLLFPYASIMNYNPEYFIQISIPLNIAYLYNNTVLDGSVILSVILSVCLSVRYRNHFPAVQFQN